MYLRHMRVRDADMAAWRRAAGCAGAGRWDTAPHVRTFVLHSSPNCVGAMFTLHNHSSQPAAYGVVILKKKKTDETGTLLDVRLNFVHEQ